MLRTSSPKALAAMLGLVALLLAANLAATLFGSGGPSIAAPAVVHAGGPSGNIVISDAPTGYIYTTNQDGDVLYVWKRDDQRRYHRQRFDTSARE